VLIVIVSSSVLKLKCNRRAVTFKLFAGAGLLTGSFLTSICLGRFSGLYTEI
jgi:hypothetical protein